MALTEEETCPPWCAPEETAATEEEGGPGACCCCCLAYIIAAAAGGRTPPCTCRRGRQAGARGSSPPSVADQVLIPGDVLCHGGWIIVLISAVPPPICRWSVVSSSGRSLCK